MSFGSFFAGLTGLQANAMRLQVIGNNLANLNTTGFKAGTVSFQDVLSGFAGVNGAGNPLQVGRGASLASINSIFAQGSMQNSALLSDIAIQGNGYFVFADEAGGQSFSRDGHFSFDGDGNLVSSSGHFVQGYSQVDANGVVTTSGGLGNIQVPTGLTAPPLATSEFSTVLNLDSDQVDPFSASMTVFDSLGAQHDVTLTFTPNGAGTWDYEISAPGDEVTGGTSGTPFVVGSGTVTFGPDGQLVTPATNPQFSVPWNNGSSAQTMDWELFDADGDALLTSFRDTSAVVSSSQNGFGVGTLQTLIIDQDGLVSGVFSNGTNLQIARFALANFNNENGLVRAGANRFLATTVAGSPTIGAANSGGRGATIANALELSNVDITREFTEMIISQRGYQANSRIITTTDEIIQEALNLKR